MLVVGPAGDQNAFSCSYSPANSPFALIASATLNDLDMDRPESNYGDCIDINAPGEMIPSPYIGSSNQEESTLSGSSASTAIVTGMLGVILTIIRSLPPLEYENSLINLLQEFSENLSSENFPILLRNLLLASNEQFSSTSSAREAHPTPMTYCDLRNINSIIWSTKEYLRKLKSAKKSSPISRVKQNFLQSQQKKLEAHYE
jgi:subtilisin family serine protease